MQMELLGISSIDFDVDRLLITYSIFIRYWIRNGSLMRQYITYRFQEDI
jgi:hypothetical protein